MSSAFADYLAAKFPLDQRSLNPEVYGALRESLAGRDRLDGLDVGTGRGAMLQRLMRDDPAASLRLTGLDRNPELLTLARTDLEIELRRQGYRVEPRDSRLYGERNGKTVEAEWIASELFDFDASPAQYDLITAHAFMDLVPLQPAVSRFARWLKAGGLFYATLNYDGGTTVFPPYENPALEAALLARYDASMEERRALGLATGGSRCGRRLYAALEASGFEIVAYGSSDWNITPLGGRYRDGDALCLQAMLDFIEGEGRAAAEIDQHALASWYRDRLDQLRQVRLGMIVHQIDILATRR